MKTSAAGRKAIIQREGCKLKAYKDTKGIWTIFVGHTAAAGPPAPKAGMTGTMAEAEEVLARDLADVEAVVNKVKVPLSQNQFDALVSLSFNIGNGAFAKSTLLKRLNKGDYAGAREAILMWNKPKEIIGRRKTEYAQFGAGKPASARPAPVATIPTPKGEAAPAPAAELIPVKVPGLDKPMVKSSTMWAALSGVGITGIASAKDAIDSLTGLDWRVTMAIVGLGACAAAYWIISQRLKYRQSQRDMVAGVKAASAEQ